jgi:hypothetical protein
MSQTRNIFFHGLGITLRRFPAFLWTYLFNLGLALAFCLPLHRQLSRLMNHSLASQRLSSGFDISVVLEVMMRIHGDQGGEMSAMASHGSVVAFLAIYFLLVPGTLFSYITNQPAKLSTLIYQGLLHFWRFVRITLLALLAGLVILGPLTVAERHWNSFVDDRFVGRTSLLLTLAGMLLVLLVASLLRLYFDLVEIYTVQLGTHLRISGRPDRRVRRTLAPALRLLRANLFRLWIIFLALAVSGATIVFFTSRTAMHMLARPHAWPMFLVAQIGLMAMLFLRFWQRGVETSLVLQHPVTTSDDSFPEPQGTYRRVTPITAVPPPPAAASHDRPHHIDIMSNPDPLIPVYPPPLSPLSQDQPLKPNSSALPDPIPNPEPPSPPLAEPDPGVFHHDPVPPSERPDEDAQDKL